MFAAIDCGTTNTRIYLLTDEGKVIADGSKKVGVRDTSITGSRAVLREGVESLYREILETHHVDPHAVRFALASGMITSEIGLIELPHLVAPVGLDDLIAGIESVQDPEVIDLGIPTYFVRGIRNNYGPHPTLAELRLCDFMRGEEVQCMGLLRTVAPKLPVNVVVLSSHTKAIHIGEDRKIHRSMTTMSGQIYEALRDATFLGVSIESGREAPRRYSDDEIIDKAIECIKHAGFVRTMLMPRFMQVLIETNGEERNLFINAGIAADDMDALREFAAQGYGADRYILVGPKGRCELYDAMLRRTFGDDLAITHIEDKKQIAELTVQGAVAVAAKILTGEDEKHV